MAKNPIQFQKGLSLTDFLAQYGTEEQCRTALTEARWRDGYRCPKCGCERATWLTRRNLFQCSDRSCRHQASVTAGTIFHGSRVGLRKWFLMMYLLTQNKASISALALSRQLGVNYSNSTTRSPGSDKATSIAGHSRVQSSLRLTVRNLVPLVRPSSVKSRDQRKFAEIGHQAPSRGVK